VSCKVQKTLQKYKTDFHYHKAVQKTTKKNKSS